MIQAIDAEPAIELKEVDLRGSAARGTEMHALPGDHVTLITRHVAELAAVVRATIERRLARA